jgi:uncharacterized protein involved in exopolysaccharide biosynthesis
MKIKKPLPSQGAPAGATTGGATIADRFKLEPTTPQKDVATVGKKGTLWALLAGVASLAVAGILTFLLYQHWEYLMPQ